MGEAPGRLGKAPDDGKGLRACEKRLELHCKAKPNIGGCQGQAPGNQGKATDDGKRLRACEKRLELHCKAKPKIGGVWGGGTGKAGDASGFLASWRLFPLKNRSKN